MICNKCEFHQTAISPCISGRGPLDAQYVVVGQGPGIEEAKKNIVWVGRAGQKLVSLLSQAKINPAKVRYTNITRCYPGKEPNGKGDRKPVASHIKACLPYFLEEMKQIQGDPVILVMGNVPMKALTGISGIMKHYATIMEWTHPETGQVYNVVPAPHPASLLHGSSAVQPDHLIQSFKKARSLVLGEKEDEVDYASLDTLDAVEEYISFLLDGYRRGEITHITIDLETMDAEKQDSLAWYEEGAAVSGIGISHKPFYGRVIPLDTSWSRLQGDLERGVILGLLTTLVEEVPIVNQNLKYDLKWMKRVLNIHPKKILGDTLLQAWCLFNQSQKKDLDSLASRHTSLRQPKKDMREAKKKLPKGQRAMYFVQKGVYTNYVCRDVDAAIRLYKVFGEDLIKLPPLLKLYKTLMVRSIPVFTDIELNGVQMDKGRLQTLEKELIDELNGIEGSLARHPYVVEAWRRHQMNKVSKFVQEYNDWCTGMGMDSSFQMALYDTPANQRTQVWASLSILHSHPIEPKETQKAVIRSYKKVIRECDKIAAEKAFKIGSLPALRVLLYDVLRFDALGHRTKKGAPSTDKDAIEALLNAVMKYREDSNLDPDRKTYIDAAHFILSSVKIWRIKEKIRSTYVSGLPRFLDSNGMLYPQFNIRATDTGRFSSSNPSVHQIPRESVVKEVFISRWDDGLILEVDESQAEVRVAAILSGDEKLLQIMQAGGDIHRSMASIIYNKSPELITSEERSFTKTIVFGILYGRGALAVAEATGMTVAEAEDLIKSFWDRFSGFAAWAEKEKAKVRKSKESWTPFGHRRLIPDIRSQKAYERAEAERKVINTPVQSTASDFTLIAIHKLQAHIKQYNLRSKIWGYVHDSVLVDSPANEFLNLSQHAVYFMTAALQLDHPWITVPLKADCKVGATWGSGMEISWNDSNIHLEGKIKDWKLLESRILQNGQFSMVGTKEEDGRISVTLVSA